MQQYFLCELQQSWQRFGLSSANHNFICLPFYRVFKVSICALCVTVFFSGIFIPFPVCCCFCCPTLFMLHASPFSARCGCEICVGIAKNPSVAKSERDGKRKKKEQDRDSSRWYPLPSLLLLILYAWSGYLCCTFHLSLCSAPKWSDSKGISLAWGMRHMAYIVFHQLHCWLTPAPLHPLAAHLPVVFLFGFYNKRHNNYHLNYIGLSLFPKTFQLTDALELPPPPPSS